MNDRDKTAARRPAIRARIARFVDHDPARGKQARNVLHNLAHRTPTNSGFYPTGSISATCERRRRRSRPTRAPGKRTAHRTRLHRASTPGMASATMAISNAQSLGQRQQDQLRKVGLGVLRRQDRYSALDDRVRRGAGSRPNRVRVLLCHGLSILGRHRAVARAQLGRRGSVRPSDAKAYREALDRLHAREAPFWASCYRTGPGSDTQAGKREPSARFQVPCRPKLRTSAGGS